jgi:HEPN domain-containing protein
LIKFIYIPAEKMAFYDQPEAFGTAVAKAFPGADYDIREAGNCFALGLHTAAVMHSMRVLESGLNALGHGLRATRSIHGWGNDLKIFQDKWDTILATKPKKLGWKRQFYPQLFLHFRYFADAWRNRAFHKPEAKYGELEAQKVFEHVREFMQLLATRLSEK